MIHMRGATAWIGLLVLSGLAACGGSEPGEPHPARADTEGSHEIAAGASSHSGAPEVEDRYQERIDEAWRKAVQGENPAYTCAALKGAAMGSDRDAASRALLACNVDVPVRYFETYIKRVEAGDRTCLDLFTEITTKLPAMTISMDAFPEIGEGEGAGDTSEAAMAGALAAVLSGGDSSGSIVKDRLRDRISQVCPDEANVIVGQRPPRAPRRSRSLPWPVRRSP